MINFLYNFRYRLELGNWPYKSQCSDEDLEGDIRRSEDRNEKRLEH